MRRARKCPTDQPLVQKSIYAECIGTPSLDYMLCLSAMKLAESKGLHRQPSTAWNLSESAVQSRGNLWWAIYIYERHIAFRSGRALVCQSTQHILVYTVSPPLPSLEEVKPADIENFSPSMTMRLLASCQPSLPMLNPRIENILPAQPDMHRSRVR